MIFLDACSVGSTITAGTLFPPIVDFEADICSRHHAGAPAAILNNTLDIPLSAFEAAVAEYEADSATDSEGDMMMP
jgi:hypothetical protein